MLYYRCHYGYCPIIIGGLRKIGVLCCSKTKPQHMSKTPATRTLSIRLPTELADRLDAAADFHGLTRTAVLTAILDGAIDTWQPATQPRDAARRDTLAGAVEVLRLELDETTARVDRLERARRSALPVRDTATQLQDDLHDAATQEQDTLTIAQLCDRHGWPRKNASRKARAAGWEYVGKRGKATLWRRS